jgi:hypothetical protein
VGSIHTFFGLNTPATLNGAFGCAAAGSSMLKLLPMLRNLLYVSGCCRAQHPSHAGSCLQLCCSRRHNVDKLLCCLLCNTVTQCCRPEHAGHAGLHLQLCCSRHHNADKLLCCLLCNTVTQCCRPEHAGHAGSCLQLCCSRHVCSAQHACAAAGCCAGCPDGLL